MIQMNASHKQKIINKCQQILFIHILDEYQRLFDKTKVEDLLGNRTYGKQLYLIKLHTKQDHARYTTTLNNTIYKNSGDNTNTNDSR